MAKKRKQDKETVMPPKVVKVDVSTPPAKPPSEAPKHSKLIFMPPSEAP